MKGEKSLCASESIIIHSGPKPRSVLAVDAYVSVPVRMVLAKTDVKILSAMSCLCIHAVHMQLLPVSQIHCNGHFRSRG